MKDPKPWKVIKSKCLIKTPWIALFHKSFKLPNGKILKDYYTLEQKDSVVIVALNDRDQIFLIKEFERGIMKPGYKFPSGSINKGEKPLDAAKRELLEETGYQGHFIKIGSFDVEPGLMARKATVFLVRNLKKTKPQPGVFELFESEWRPINKVKNLIDSGKIKNIFVIVSFYFLEKFLKPHLAKALGGKGV